MNPSQSNTRDEEIPYSGTPLSANFGSYGLQIMRAKNMLMRIINLCEARKLNSISTEYFVTVKQLKEDLEKITEKVDSLFHDFITVNKMDGTIKKLSVLKENLELNNQNYDTIVNVLNTIREKKLELEKSIKNHETEKNVLKNNQLLENEEMMATLKQLKAELNLNAMKYQDAEHNKNIINQQYGELVKSISDANEKYKQLQLETRQFKTKNELLLGEKSKMQNQCDQKISETNMIFEKSIQELIKEFDTKIDRTDEMKLKLNGLTTQIKQLEDQMVENANTLNLHQSQMANLNVERTELNNQLAERKRSESNTVASHLEIIKNLKYPIAEMKEKSKFERDVIIEQEKKYAMLMEKKRTYGIQINMLKIDKLQLSNELSKITENTESERDESLAENKTEDRMTTRTISKRFKSPTQSLQSVSKCVRFSAENTPHEDKEILDFSDYSQQSIVSSYQHFKNPRQCNPSGEKMTAYYSQGVRLPSTISPTEDIMDIISNSTIN